MGEGLRGRLLWAELMTTDLPAAERFYTDVVRWTTTPFDGAGMPYLMFGRSAEALAAGAMPLPPELAAHGVPPNWGLYFAVEAIEPAAADVARLGGSPVSEVMEVPGIGRMQAMRDPQGAAFSIYQPAEAPPPEAAAALGEVSWIELLTTDAPAALDFYQKLFGWQPTEAMDMGEMGKYHMFGRSAHSMGGMMNKAPEMAQVPPHWGLYFRVTGLDGAVARVTAGGGKILNGPMEVPGGDRIVNCMDPQGAAFSLHARQGE
ncbi:MAG: VOC family protein [Vicinamibacterales bacterium]